MICVATTVPPYVMDTPDHYLAWLYEAEAIAESHPVKFFAAIELDARGIEHFKPFTDRLRELGGDWWTFGFDDGADEITTGNRLRRITMGQNIATVYAEDTGATHLLFMAADCKPPADTIPKLLELDWPIVGGEVSTYCLNGPEVRNHPGTGRPFDFPVMQQMATAAFIMIDTRLSRRLRWRYDAQAGMSDDPCMEHDAKAIGYPTLVRKDVVGVHYPITIPSIEDRHADRRVRR